MANHKDICGECQGIFDGDEPCDECQFQAAKTRIASLEAENARLNEQHDRAVAAFLDAHGKGFAAGLNTPRPNGVLDDVLKDASAQITALTASLATCKERMEQAEETVAHERERAEGYRLDAEFHKNEYADINTHIGGQLRAAIARAEKAEVKHRAVICAWCGQAVVSTTGDNTPEALEAMRAHDLTCAPFLAAARDEAVKQAFEWLCEEEIGDQRIAADMAERCLAHLKIK